MKKQNKQKLTTGLDNTMDYIIKKGFKFSSLSKGIILAMSITLTVTTLTNGVETQGEDVSRMNVVHAEELVKEEKIDEVATNVEVTAVSYKEEPAEEVNEEATISNLWEEGYTEIEKDFLTKVSPVAIEVASEYQVYPSIIVAQAILESDWGQSELAVNANNYFGVKGSFDGGSYSKPTMEDDGTGVQTQIIADFAKYPTMKESIESNAQLVRQGTSFDASYYKGAWVENTTSHEDATLALTGTYATDIYYNDKVNTIIEEHNLEELDNIVYN